MPILNYIIQKCSQNDFLVVRANKANNETRKQRKKDDQLTFYVQLIKNRTILHTDSWLVSWCLTSFSSTNMAISEKKGQGWKAIPTQYGKASDILTSSE